MKQFIIITSVILLCALQKISFAESGPGWLGYNCDNIIDPD